MTARAVHKFDPRVAFGLRALSAGLKAKCAKAPRTEGPDLIQAAVDLLPDDPAAARAARDYADTVVDHPQKAGAALIGFLSSFPAPVPRTAADIEAGLRRISADRAAQWQTRKDCGHD